jgi:hypothetical protein
MLVGGSSVGSFKQGSYKRNDQPVLWAPDTGREWDLAAQETTDWRPALRSIKTIESI